MLVEYRDRLELTPYSWVREFIGLGRFNAKEIGPQPGEDMHPLFNAVMGDSDIWVVACWRQFDDGREETQRIQYLDPLATEAEARKAYEREVRFTKLTKADLESLSKCFKASAEDLAYIEERFPGESSGPPSSKSIEERDLYEARLKVLAGMQPKTVELLIRAESASNPEQRSRLEREAVQAYFADLAHHWTEDLVKEWQRHNPIGSEWMCHFAQVFQEPEREIDSINHELALNWIKRGYHLLTAEELSDRILVATGQRVMPATLKKRRERLGLTTKRSPGPKPNVD